ncbi:hypothetical protein RYX36_032650 [Vicia faba]
MALGKSSRGDGRNSSHYCSTVPVAVFVAFCLVGLWIAMSSIVLVQDFGKLRFGILLNGSDFTVWDFYGVSRFGSYFSAISSWC